MTPDLFWLTAITLATIAMVFPYVLNRIAVRGLAGALANPSPDAKPQAPWAVRAQAAHENAIENLVIFAPLVLVAAATGAASSTTAMSAMVYFFARIAHYVVYTAGIPVLRTLTFAIGAVCQVAIGFAILQAG